MGGHVGGYFSVPPRTVWIPCCMSRLVGSSVWDLGPDLVGCRLWGFLVFWLAWSFRASSGHARAGPSSMIDSSIYHQTARIRSRTLHPRIGAHQNGSTSVRFEGRVHYHHLPEDRESKADGISEANYLYKLRRKSTIASNMKVVADRAAGFMSAASSWWSSGKSAERQFGDSGNKKFMACEERRSSASKIDMHSEFDARSLQAMPVEEMANENKPTPPVLPQLFQLDGQTGRLQAEQAERAEEFEKESESEYLSDDSSYKLKAIKNFVSTIGTMHEKKTEAMHNNNIFPEYQQGGLPVPARLNRSAMRYLFGTHALHQHHHPHHELCQRPIPPPSSLPSPWPPPLPPYSVITATWAANARQVIC